MIQMVTSVLSGRYSSTTPQQPAQPRPNRVVDPLSMAHVEMENPDRVSCYEFKDKFLSKFTAVFLNRPLESEADASFEALTMQGDRGEASDSVLSTVTPGAHLGRLISFKELPVALQFAVLTHE